MVLILAASLVYQADGLIPLLHHLYSLSMGLIPFSHNIHKLNPAGLQSRQSIIYMMLGISSCPLMPAHMHTQPALRGLSSLEL
jgi:hypothetical protein